MKVSLNLAQEYSNVDIKKIGVDNILQKIGAQLGAVEEVVDWRARYAKVVVAKIITSTQHPNADKLHVVTIDDGGITKLVNRDKDGYVEVVCGAANVREGLLVAWLPPGSTVPSSYGKDSFVLEARALRGVVSNGMLASPKELALYDDHDGILELTQEEISKDKTQAYRGLKIKPGDPITKYFGLDDVIIDCENKMFTHRPDCFGNLGVARELAGIQQLKFKSPDWYTLEPVIELQRSEHVKQIKLDIEVKELVPRYMLVAMEGIKVGPSPVWLQACLNRLGIRPINNIVDMTNYMMMLTGQPLHAFDFDKVSKDGNAHIVVRKPKKSETLTLLDGKTITPRDEAILICTDDKAIALGGVMGGNNSEIDDKTTRILIECATFDMYNIRKTSMEHGIFTDAVTRFTKGQSPWQCPAVLAQAVNMVRELNPGASAVGKPMDSNFIKSENQDIAITAEFINSRLGSDLSLKKIAELLENVEFKVTTMSNDKTKLHVTAPFWRVDIEQPEDIVEEVGRLYGFDNLPVELPARSARAAARDDRLSLKQLIREILASAGANEVLTYSFVHGNLLQKVGQPESEAYAIRNALSPDLQYYRLSLTPSLLDKINMNLRAGYDEFALFELNKAHLRMNGLTKENVPKELNIISLVYAANDRTAPEGAAFYQARKYLDFLGHKLGISFEYQVLKQELKYPETKPFDWQRSALIRVLDSDIIFGQIGEYRAEVRRNLKLPVHSAGFELDLEALLLARKPISYKLSSRFPTQDQDITLEVARVVTFAKSTKALKSALDAAGKEHGYIVNIEPRNIYKPSEDKLRYTYRITLSNPSRTLVTDEVNILLEATATTLKSQLQAVRI